MPTKFRILACNQDVSPLFIDRPIVDPETGVPIIDEKTGQPFSNFELAYREVPVIDAETGLPLLREDGAQVTKRVSITQPAMLNKRLVSLAKVGPLAGRMCTLTLRGIVDQEFELGDIACEVHAEALAAAIADGLIERVTE